MFRLFYIFFFLHYCLSFKLSANHCIESNLNFIKTIADEMYEKNLEKILSDDAAPSKINLVTPIDSVVKKTKKILINGHKNGFNPSILKLKEDLFLCVFRDFITESPDSSGMFIVELNGAFDPINEAKLLFPEYKNSLRKTHVLSQPEDARLFHINNRIYVVYNDSVADPWNQNRQMFIAEIIKNKGQYSLKEPTLLFYSNANIIEKNWVPFEYDGEIFFSYSINPHFVLYYIPEETTVEELIVSSAEIDWCWGKDLRGGTPALLIDDHYLGFFHTTQWTRSPASTDKSRLHFYIGAYVFEKDLPFSLEKISQYPIIGKNFYFPEGERFQEEKLVVYPVGFSIDGDNIYLSYGIDDKEMWIATLSLSELYKTLTPVISFK